MLEDVANAWVCPDGSLIRGDLGVRLRERRGVRLCGKVVSRGNGLVGRGLVGHLVRRLNISEGEECLFLAGLQAVRCLQPGDVIVLHAYAPTLPGGLDAWNHAAASCAGGQIASGGLRVSDSGRKTEAAWLHACEAAEALDAGEALPTTVTAKQRMNLIDDHIAQITKKRGDGGMLVQE